MQSNLKVNGLRLAAKGKVGAFDEVAIGDELDEAVIDKALHRLVRKIQRIGTFEKIEYDR